MGREEGDEEARRFFKKCVRLSGYLNANKKQKKLCPWP